MWKKGIIMNEEKKRKDFDNPIEYLLDLAFQQAEYCAGNIPTCPDKLMWRQAIFNVRNYTKHDKDHHYFNDYKYVCAKCGLNGTGNRSVICNSIILGRCDVCLELTFVTKWSDFH